ncbi:MAG: RDD family protein [Lachnospiraceae bacterium]|nr:RDD family protein [Lachnospiraceae bacterium]
MQNQLENKVYAGFFVRLVAFAVDSLIAAMAAGIVKLPFAFLAMAGAGFLKSNFIFHYSVLDVAGYLGVAAYFVLLTYFTHSTPGKMLFRLEVVTTDQEWSFVNILYRETVGRFLSSLFGVGYLVVLGQPEKQGFHDMLCDTRVVYKNMLAGPAGKSVQPVSPNAAQPMPAPGVQPVSPDVMQTFTPAETSVFPNPSDTTEHPEE